MLSAQCSLSLKLILLTALVNDLHQTVVAEEFQSWHQRRPKSTVEHDFNGHEVNGIQEVNGKNNTTGLFIL